MKRANPSSIIAFSLLIALVSGCAAEKDRAYLDTPPPRLAVRIDTESLSCLAMNPMKFSAVVSGGDGDYSYIWDFNAADGYTVDGFQSAVQHIYPEPGQYTVSVHAADGSGASGEADIEISVADRKYDAHQPIMLREVFAAYDKPYIIDGYDITNPHGNGITLRHCSNVIIRNCYIHGCERSGYEDGQAVCLEDCRNIAIQNLYVKNNRSGIVINGNPEHLSSDLLLENNVVVGCRSHDGVSFVNAKHSEVRYNILYNNGEIWENRISGISFNGTFHDISVHHNLVVNSDSDGIECMGNDWQEIAENVEVYANVLRENGEQGVWFFRVSDSRIHSNYIEGSHHNGVCLEGWVSNVLIDHNIIVRCGGTPEMEHHGGAAVGLQCSPDNIIQSNICIDSSCGDVSISYHEKDEHWMKGMDSRFLRSAGNVVDSNVMCSSESNVNIAEGVSAPSITNNVFWQRGRGRHYYGCGPDKTNIKAKPLFRAPERGDFTLLTRSPGYDAIRKAPAPQPAGKSDWHFGTLAFDYKYVPLIMDVEKIARGFEIEARDAAETGAYWIRPHLTELFAWGFIERQPGQYDWTIPDLAVRICQKYGLQLAPQIWTLSMWDQKLPPGDMSSPMDALFALKRWPWTHGDALKPNDMKAYLAWLRAMVERYDRDGVNDMPGLRYPILHYEILNEPQGEDEARPFFEVQKESYIAIKEQNPDVKVILGGQISPEELKMYLKMGIQEYCDVINIHGSLEHTYLEVIDTSGVEKSLWITEIGHHVEEYSFEELGAERRQAEYLIKAYTRSFANGADKIFWIEVLGWIKPDMELNFQLPRQQQQACLHPAGQRPRLAYYTHKLLASKIGRFSSVERVSLADGVECYKFSQDGKIFHILWNEGHGATRVYLDVPSHVVFVTDLIPEGEGGIFKSFKVRTENMIAPVEVGETPILVEPR